MIGALILGLVAGAIAKLLMPGDDPGGIFVTIILGLVGAFVGYLIFTRLLGIGDNDAFDLGGLLSAIIGTLIVLGIYRVVVGRNAGHGRGGRVHRPCGHRPRRAPEAAPAPPPATRASDVVVDARRVQQPHGHSSFID